MSNALLKYVLVKNSLPEATAPYLGRLVGNGTWDSEAFSARIAAKQPELRPATVRLVFQALFSVAAEAMAEMPCRISLGAVTFEPTISGSLPSMDAQLGDENEVYVAVRLSDALRNAAAGVSPVRVSEDALGIRLDNVQDESASANGRGMITGTEPFALTGLKITGSGEGETVKAVAADGTEAVAVDVTDCGTGQRIIARLATALPAGRGRIYLTTRGFGTPPGHGVITRHISVTIVAGEAPTGLTLTGVHAPGIESPMIRVESSVWFDGTGLDGWTAGRDSIWCKNNRAEEAEFVRMDGDGSGAAVEFDGGMLKADEGAWSVLTDLGIVEGSEVRFKVTIDGQSAEIVATVAEA